MMYDPDEDDPHVGTFGQVWFKHAYDVEHDGEGNHRAICACDWKGDWFPHDAPAKAQGEQHPLLADFTWDHAPGRHSASHTDQLENPHGLVAAAAFAFVVVASIIVAWYLLLWRR